jgi:hypothetical protein
MDAYMKTKRNLIFAVVAAGLLTILAGCSTSKLVDVWSDSSFKPPSLNKMLVIYGGKNQATRHTWEDDFCLELAKHYVSAMPSYRLFPDTWPDTAQVLEIVRANGFDGVLAARRFPPQTSVQDVGLYVTNKQGMVYERNTPGFNISYRDIVHEGYVDSEKVDVRSVNVWTTGDDGRLIWRATCDTREPNSGPQVHSEIVALTISQLTKRHIIDAVK